MGALPNLMMGVKLAWKTNSKDWKSLRNFDRKIRRIELLDAFYLAREDGQKKQWWNTAGWNDSYQI